MISPSLGGWKRVSNGALGRNVKLAPGERWYTGMRGGTEFVGPTRVYGGA